MVAAACGDGEGVETTQLVVEGEGVETTQLVVGALHVGASSSIDRYSKPRRPRHSQITNTSSARVRSMGVQRTWGQIKRRTHGRRDGRAHSNTKGAPLRPGSHVEELSCRTAPSLVMPWGIATPDWFSRDTR